MNGWTELFALGGHGAYLLGAYAVGLIAVVAECIEVFLRWRNVVGHLRRVYGR